MSRGILDTSVLIAAESGRPINSARLPSEAAISTVTVGELRAGVLAAADEATRMARLETLEMAGRFEALNVDEPAAVAWSILRLHLNQTSRRADVNDLWIAATAMANSIPVYTQDDDFDPLADVDGLTVIRI